MSQYHLKRHAAHRNINIARKENKFVTRPRPGAHSFDLAISLGNALKMIGKAETLKEAKFILNKGLVLVDGKVRKSHKHPVGFTDVLSIPSLKEHYKVWLTEKGLTIQPIKEEESKAKTVKITGKTMLPKGKLQLHTFDGRNILLDKKDYKTGDSLVITLPGQEVKKHLRFEKGAKVFLYKGAHAGASGEVEAVEGEVLIFKSGGKTRQTRKEYALVVG